METRTRRVKVDGVDAGEAEVIPPGRSGAGMGAGARSAGSSASGAAGQAVDDPLIQMIAQLMDSAFQIPGTKIRVGLDPLMGLIPGLGDYLSAMVSVVLVGLSSRYGVPKIVIARMVTNVLVNTFVGSIPVAGDFFSVWFKSNALNYELLQKHAGPRRASTRGDWVFFGLLVGGMVLVLGLAVVGMLALIQSIIAAQ